MRHLSAFTHQALLTILGLALAGCGGAGGRPESAHATGRVIYLGQPVVEGTINLISPTGDAGSAPLMSDGKFEISTGIPPGTYLAFVTPPRVTQAPKPGEPPPTMAQFAIPERYQSEVTTPLKIVIEQGDNSDVEVILE